jgi:hypothetical protein
MLPIVTLGLACAAPPASGPAVGDKPAPYSFVVCTGAQRGKLHCFVCDAADKPFVAFFAREPSPALGTLARRCEDAARLAKGADAKGWVTFLKPDQLAFDATARRFATEHNLAAFSVGVFEDVVGPPDYKIAADAAITVVIASGAKVRSTFAFTDGSLGTMEADGILKAWKATLPPGAPK